MVKNFHTKTQKYEVKKYINTLDGLASLCGKLFLQIYLR